jgi:collagen type I/II/III/V/XI/XXIV/XXVII alpha
VSNTIDLSANSQASLVTALDSVDAQGTATTPTTFVLNLTPGAQIGLNADLPAINLAAGNSLIINGGGDTLRGDGNERGLFVYAGTVEIANLTITNTVALGGSGGNGWEGGGGGLGAGGGLFVGANAVVALGNVNFVANAAIGGNGGRANGNGYYGLGGGGGMGGRGGNAGYFGQYGHFHGSGHAGGGGGGGIGRGAQGYGATYAAGTGIVQGVTAYNAGRYYSAPGGGGGGLSSGGGIAPRGHDGGFGGGGGPYGSGGFGGGAGAFGKAGGWGGGGAGGAFPGAPGFGGGAGQAGNYQHESYGGYYYYFTRLVPGKANGGGGLGAGGNVFVQEGGVLAIAGGNMLAGAVQGGQPGGGSAGAGAALGSAAFLQGYGILYLSPPAGETMTIAGAIADQAGAGLGPSVQGSGTIAVAGAGVVDLTAASSYTGGTAINGGTLEVQNPQALGSGAVFFGAGGNGVLDIASAPPANPIYDFGYGETIELAAKPSAVSYSQSQHTLSYDGNVLNFDPSSAPPTVFYDAATGAVTAPCFAAGTRIATTRGDVAVEHLRIGDTVCLAEGGTAPVIWLGHRRLDCRRHARPQDVHPVRVAAHAFGLGRPARDLRLSPDHAVFVDGVLIPVRYLLNGATVTQEDAARVTYWHVELDRHAVLLAEGLPAETYLDTGNRTAFAGGAVVMAHPDFARGVWARAGCAPLVLSGAARDAVHRRLLAQARALGHALTGDPGLRVLADGAELSALADGDEWLLYRLPQGTRRVHLRSHRFVPAEMDTGSNDARRLGVALRLFVNNESPPAAAFAAGWHAPEGDGSWRWTDGAATLALPPLSAPGWLRLSLMPGGARYWADMAHSHRAASAS